VDIQLKGGRANHGRPPAVPRETVASRAARLHETNAISASRPSPGPCHTVQVPPTQPSGWVQGHGRRTAAQHPCGGTCWRGKRGEPDQSAGTRRRLESGNSSRGVTSYQSVGTGLPRHSREPSTSDKTRQSCSEGRPWTAMGLREPGRVRMPGRGCNTAAHPSGRRGPQPSPKSRGPRCCRDSTGWKERGAGRRLLEGLCRGPWHDERLG